MRKSKVGLSNPLDNKIKDSEIEAIKNVQKKKRLESVKITPITFKNPSQEKMSKTQSRITSLRNKIEENQSKVEQNSLRSKVEENLARQVQND